MWDEFLLISFKILVQSSNMIGTQVVTQDLDAYHMGISGVGVVQILLRFYGTNLSYMESPMISMQITW